VHFFDMLLWLFGDIKENIVHVHRHDRAAGYLELEKARVRWFLSINRDTLPDKLKKADLPTYRSILIEGEEFEFSGGFTELHTRSYEKIIAGEGFGIHECRDSIELVYQIRNASPAGVDERAHPMAELPLAPHPFGRGG
jgi:UDP-N-acetyl-2-amino-2-deoxyglucuronate dehydrogenase